MRYLIAILVFYSGVSFGQGTTNFGATRPQDTGLTKGQLKATAYATVDTNKVLGPDANGRIVLRTKVPAGAGSGTVTSITQGRGIILTPNPITTSGTVIVDTNEVVTYFYLFANYYTQAQTANLVNVRKLKSDSINIDGYTTRRQTASDIHDSILAIPLASPTVNGHMDSNNYYLNMQDAATGCYIDSGLTIDGGGTTYSINDVKGWIVNNTGASLGSPNVSKIHYTGSTGNAPILAGDATYVLITPSLTVVQQGTMPTPKQRRENIYIGKVVHPNHTVISAVNNNPDYAFSAMSALRDLWTPIRLINENIVPSANGANLNINVSAGYLWGNGINFVSDPLQPNTVTYAGVTPATFQYRTQSSAGVFSNTTVIDPANYDNGGTITPVGSAARATNQRIYLFPTGQIRIQYGQEWYASLNLAIAGLDSEPFIVNSNNASTGILIGVLSVRANATDLTNPLQAAFRLVSKFGELASGSAGVSTTTLQQAYDNSTVPQILTSTTEGALSVRRGTTADIDTVLVIQNGAGVNKITMTGNGALTADSLKGKLSGSDIYPPLTNGTVTSVATTAPLTGGTITGAGTISIPVATSTTDGYLSAANWVTFNGKGQVNAITTGPNLSATGTTTVTIVADTSAGHLATKTDLIAFTTQTVTATSYTTSVTITSTTASPMSTVRYKITAQAGALLFNAPTGSWADGQHLNIAIYDNGTIRALTYNAAFSGANKPASTVVGEWTELLFIYNSSATNKWQLMGSKQTPN